MTFYLETLITSMLQSWTTYQRNPEAQRPTQPQMQHKAQHVGPANHFGVTTQNVPNSRINETNHFITEPANQQKINQSRSTTSLRIKKEDQSIKEQAPA